MRTSWFKPELVMSAAQKHLLSITVFLNPWFGEPVVIRAWIPVVFVIFVGSVISTNPALNSFPKDPQILKSVHVLKSVSAQILVSDTDLLL